MSSPHYGNDYVYAKSRLQGTVVRYENKPFYVDHVAEDTGITHGLDILSQTWFDVASDELDLTPLPTGYINQDVTSVFVSRTPIRWYKQGVAKHNLKPNPKVPVTSCGFGKMLAGIYPPIDSVIEHLDCGEVEKQAFTRNFAIQTAPNKPNELQLSFQDRLVGQVHSNGYKKGVNFLFDPQYTFLQETLERDMK